MLQDIDRRKLVKEEAFVFEVNNQNILLNHMYKQDNIRIIEGMAKNKKCIIICSSNGIYFPNTYEEFRWKIIGRDFYEGERISSLLIEYVERIILIRDIRKSFYVTGISEKYNSIDSVLCMLKELTEGYEIITAGGSAGGYMAAIVGTCLDAQYVVNAGGQWNLYRYNHVVERYDFLKREVENKVCNKWFDLNMQLRYSSVPIFYMYGALNESDIQQVSSAADLDNIYPVGIKSSAHAQSVSTEPYLRLLCGTKEDVLKIYHINEGCMVDIDTLENQINTFIEFPQGMQFSWTTTNERKQKAYIDLLYEWVQEKQSICEAKKSYSGTKVAIWGKGRYCKLLMKELEQQNIQVNCIIETQPLDKEFEGIPVVNIENLYSDTDTIIVVPYYDMENIRKQVYRYCKDVKVIGIDEYIRCMN